MSSILHRVGLTRRTTRQLQPTIEAPSFDALVAHGDRARDARDWLAAAIHYRAALEHRPDALGIWVQLGHVQKEAREYAKAALAYRRFLNSNETDADIHLQFGHLFMHQDRPDEALPWYHKALALADADSSIAIDARRGIEEAAAGPLRKKKRAALALTDAKRFADAYTAVLDLVENEQCENLTGILGNVCKELGRFEEARRYYGRYRAYAETATADVRFDAELQMGHFEKVQRNYAAAITHYARAHSHFDEASQPSCTREELMGDIRVCLERVTTAIVLI